MKLRMGLKYRMIRMNLLMIVPVLILYSSVALSTIYRLMRSSTVELLTSESYNSQIYIMDQLSHRWGVVEQEGELRAAAPAFCKTIAENLALRVQIYSQTGELLGDSSLTPDGERTGDIAMAMSGVKAYTFFRLDGQPSISFASPIYSGSDTLGAVRYLGYQEDVGMVISFALMLVSFTALAIAICFVVSIFIANSFSRPILELKDAMSNPTQDFPPTAIATAENSDVEVRELEQTFRTLWEVNTKNIRRLGEEKEKQNLFFNSATHQLKTPLTSILGYSDIIKRISTDEDVVISADYIEKAGKNLLELVEDIISISRFQKTEYEFDPEWFRLDILCRECMDLLSPRLSRSGIVLNNRCGPMDVFFDKERMREVVLNLLDNCILHSGCRCIQIYSDTMPLCLTIEDDGKGLSDEQRKRLFEPFYHEAKSDGGGSGLGLSICKTIMVAQGGDIEVAGSVGAGTKITLYFRKKDSRDSQPHHMARRI